MKRIEKCDLIYEQVHQLSNEYLLFLFYVIYDELNNRNIKIKRRYI